MQSHYRSPESSVNSLHFSLEFKQLYIKASDFYRNEKLHSKGIKLIDAAIIKATIDSKSELWILDKKIIACLDNDFLFEDKNSAPP